MAHPHVLHTIWLDSREPTNTDTLWIKPLPKGQYGAFVYGQNGWIMTTALFKGTLGEFVVNDLPEATEDSNGVMSYIDKRTLDSLDLKAVRLGDLVKNIFEKKVNYLKDKDGYIIFPVTHEDAVIDTQGKTLTEKLSGKQDTLKSGENIKTINNQPVLGEGNITIESEPVDTSKCVKVEEQTFTSAQQALARSNIGAGTSNFSGAYNDLTGKPTIPDAQIQSDWNQANSSSLDFIKNKPSIPAAQIQSDWNQTDNTAFDFIKNKPTIPSVSGFEETSNKTSSLSSSSTNTQYPSAKAAYDEIHPASGSSQPSGGMLPNVLYNLGTLTGSVAFTLATPSDANVTNHYYWTFNTGSTAPTIRWPFGVTSWIGGSAPTISASKHYEVSVLNGIGVYFEV